MPAALALLPALSAEVCTNTACTHSYTHRDECECTQCDGAGHGIAYAVDQLIGAATFTARADVVQPGFTRAMLAATDDEPVAVNYRGRTLLLDPEDVF